MYDEAQDLSRLLALCSLLVALQFTKSKSAPTMLTTRLCKTEQFMLNSWPSSDSMLAIANDKAQSRYGSFFQICGCKLRNVG